MDSITDTHACVCMRMVVLLASEFVQSRQGSGFEPGCLSLAGAHTCGTQAGSLKPAALSTLDKLKGQPDQSVAHLSSCSVLNRGFFWHGTAWLVSSVLFSTSNNAAHTTTQSSGKHNWRHFDTFLV